ncbi:hypothetical protein Hdeb2414_s0018g00520701 [Helianthus debilis subsp. tardiflorus]
MSRLHYQNYGTVGIGEPMGIRVLSGVHCLEVLAYLLPLCNEDTGPVTPALIFRGVTWSCRHMRAEIIMFVTRYESGFHRLGVTTEYHVHGL